MSNIETWRRTLERVTLRLPFKAGIGEIRCSAASDDFTVALWFDAIDSETGAPMRFHSARIIPLRLSEPRDQLAWLRAQWCDVLEHELDECLRFDGKLLRDPHVTINERCPDHEGCAITHVWFVDGTSYACTKDTTKRPARRVWSEALGASGSERSETGGA
jgi:hypothetical protein